MHDAARAAGTPGKGGAGGGGGGGGSCCFFRLSRIIPESVVGARQAQGPRFDLPWQLAYEEVLLKSGQKIQV